MSKAVKSKRKLFFKVVIIAAAAAVLIAAAATNPEMMRRWDPDRLDPFRREVVPHYAFDEGYDGIKFDEFYNTLEIEQKNHVFFALVKSGALGGEVIGIGAFGKYRLFDDMKLMKLPFKSPSRKAMGEVRSTFLIFMKLFHAAVAEAGNPVDITEKGLGFVPPADSKWWTFTVMSGGSCVATLKAPLGKVEAGATLTTDYRSSGYRNCFYYYGNEILMIIGNYHIRNFGYCSHLGEGGGYDAGSDGDEGEGDCFECAGGERFNDPRDEQGYRMINIDGATWMLDNVNYETGDSWCYGDDPVNCAKYGRLYTWDAAMKACPDGWHLPSFHEWNALIGDYHDAGRRLKAGDGWVNDGNGMSENFFWALPGGSRNSSGGFVSVGEFGRWWTADDADDGNATRLDMGARSAGVSTYASKKSNGYSVRCVRD